MQGAVPAAQVVGEEAKIQADCRMLLLLPSPVSDHGHAFEPGKKKKKKKKNRPKEKELTMTIRVSWPAAHHRQLMSQPINLSLQDSVAPYDIIKLLTLCLQLCDLMLQILNVLLCPLPYGPLSLSVIRTFSLQLFGRQRSHFAGPSARLLFFRRRHFSVRAHRAAGGMRWMMLSSATQDFGVRQLGCFSSMLLFRAARRRFCRSPDTWGVESKGERGSRIAGVGF